MTFKATINQTKSTKKRIANGLLLFILLFTSIYISIFISTIFNTEINNFYIGTLTLTCLGIIFFLFKKDYFKDTTQNGTIELNEFQLSINHQDKTNLYLLSEISDLRIYFHSYKDMQIGRSQFDGDMNKISFNFKGIKTEHQFDIDSLEHLEDLKVLFGVFYHEGIKFKEYYWQRRSFMHNTNLLYAEIQEFKAKYKTEWL